MRGYLFLLSDTCLCVPSALQVASHIMTARFYIDNVKSLKIGSGKP